MKLINGSVIFSHVTGITLVLFGAFWEPLLMVLGILIMIYGIAASVIENHRRKYRVMDLDKTGNSELEPKQITA